MPVTNSFEYKQYEYGLLCRTKNRLFLKDILTP